MKQSCTTAPVQTIRRNYTVFGRHIAQSLLAGLTAAAMTTAWGGQEDEVPSEPAPVASPVAEQQPAPRRRAPEPVRVREQAPERYVVKKGDTLWDITTLFLSDPWLWPEIWQVNPQIHDPHLIYPGDVIVIFYGADGQQHLRVERDGEVYITTLDVEKVSPRVRTESVDVALPLIPNDVIRPFLTLPRIIDKDTLKNAPYVMQETEGRLLAGADLFVFVRGTNAAPGTRFNIVRPKERYRDPETRDIIGYEAMFVGEGIIVASGDPGTMRLTSTKREVLQGDLLLEIVEEEFSKDIQPRVPERPVEGVIFSVVDGFSQVGQFQIVVINRGARDGLEVGHGLLIFRAGVRYKDKLSKRGLSKKLMLPDQRSGVLLVFRVFDRVSYGLIMRATDAIHIGDMVRSPNL